MRVKRVRCSMKDDLRSCGMRMRKKRRIEENSMGVINRKRRMRLRGCNGRRAKRKERRGVELL